MNEVFEQKLSFHILAPPSGELLPPQKAVYKGMPLAG